MAAEDRELSEARALLAKFEAEVHRPESVAHLSEALTLLADIRDSGESNRDATVASNIVLAYATKVQREVERLAREHIVHIEIILHWLDVLKAFESAGFELPPGMDAARSTLILKKMSPTERQSLLEKLQAMDQDKAI